jgi:hypothetical protein
MQSGTRRATGDMLRDHLLLRGAVPPPEVTIEPPPQAVELTQ